MQYVRSSRLMKIWPSGRLIQAVTLNRKCIHVVQFLHMKVYERYLDRNWSDTFHRTSNQFIPTVSFGCCRIVTKCYLINCSTLGHIKSMIPFCVLRGKSIYTAVTGGSGPNTAKQKVSLQLNTLDYDSMQYKQLNYIILWLWYWSSYPRQKSTWLE